MPVILTCPQGHQWEATGGPSTLPSLCPSCGSLAVTCAGLVNGGSAATTDHGGSLSTPAPAAPLSPGALGGTTAIDGARPAWNPAATAAPRYRPLRLHAKGGLGEVHVADDNELHRQVALKRIQQRHAGNDDSRRRFLVEAEVTARLEHPGIVPVYGLVADESGNPCYAMRFIEGETLHDAIQRFHEQAPGQDRGHRSLALRQLLNRLIVACNALAYAHSRGVVHRDIKPQNIMLGPYGETLVVDWGLAKTLAERENQGPRAVFSPHAPEHDGGTEPGVVMGTPAYMSPEQAAGRWDAVGPPSDIYSLGVTLYVLLTGRLPFEARSSRELLERVQTGAFPAPRERNPSVPRPLEAVCLKAMAHRPEDRYATALELAGDLEQWLADEPVQAYREPWTARVRRWMSRHRPLVTGGVVLLFAVVVLLLVVVYFVNDAWEQSELARLAIEERERQTEAQRALAVQRGGEAQANLKLARANLQQADHAIKEMLSRLADERLVHLPQFDEDRREILNEALTLRRKLLNENPRDPETRQETGLAYTQMGQILQGLGQEVEALKAFEQSVAMLQALNADHPGVIEHQKALAESYSQLGLFFWRSEASRLRDASDCFARARDLWTKLANAEPGKLDHQAQLAMTHYRLASIYVRSDRKPEGEKEFDKTLQLQRKLVEAGSSNPDYLGTLGSIHNSAGAHYSNVGRLEEAEKHYEEGRGIFEQVVPRKPKVLKYREELSFASANLAFIYQRTGRFREAETACRRAIELQQPLADAHPQITRYQESLAGNLSGLATILVQLDKDEEAESLVQRALAIQEKLVLAHPGTARYRHELADTHGSMAGVFLSRKDFVAAERSYRESIRLHEQAVQASPENRDYALSLGGAWVNTGNLLLRALNRPGEALACYDQGVAVLDELRRKSETDPMPRLFQRNGHWGRADALGRLGRHADAVKDWDRAIELDAGSAKPMFRVFRALSLAHAGEHEAAVAEAKALSAAERVPAILLYNLACVYSVAAGQVKDDVERRDRYGAAAVELLKRAVAAGFKNPEHLKKDPDFNPIRQREDFRKLTVERN